MLALAALIMMIAASIAYVALRYTPGPAVAPDDGPEAASLPELPPFPIETLEPIVAEQIRAARAALDANPRDAQANGRLGMLFQTYELYGLAEPCYRRAVALAPDDLRWRYYLALVLVANGNRDAASAEFDRVLAARPDDVPALIERAAADLNRNELDAALRGYERAISLRPDAAEAYCGAAQVLLKRGDVAAAEQRLVEALHIAPRYGKARYVLGQVLRKLGRMDEAAEQLHLAEEQKDDIPHVHDPLRQDLANLAVGAIETLHHGTEKLEAGDLPGAIRLFEQALRLNANLAEAHANLGAALLTMNELDRAAVHLRRAIEIDPGYMQASYNLGVIFHRRKDFAAAVEQFRKTLAIRTDHFETQYGLGAALEERGQLDAAVEHLRAAILLRPDDARPYKKLADVFSNLGRYGDAVAVYEEAARVLPGDASITDRLAWLLATCPDSQWRDPDEAVRLAEEVCRITNERVPRALDTLAAAYACAGRFEEAIATATQALGLAEAKADADLMQEIRSRIELYQSGRAYHERITGVTPSTNPDDS